MGPEIQAVQTEAAARPAAHYSQAVRAGTYVWTAGSVGVDPTTNEVPPDLEGQIELAIRNVAESLRAAGGDLRHVVKTTCFVTSREDFLRLDPVYSSHFPSPPPARTTIVCQLVREEFLFEIEAVAVVPA